MKLLIFALISLLIFAALATPRHGKQNPSDAHKTTRSRSHQKHGNRTRSHHRQETSKQHVKKHKKQSPKRLIHKRRSHKRTDLYGNKRQQVHFKTFSPHGDKVRCVKKCIHDHMKRKMSFYKVNFICYRACGVALVDVHTLCRHYPEMCHKGKMQRLRSPVRQRATHDKTYHLSFPFHLTYINKIEPKESRFTSNLKNIEKTLPPRRRRE